MASGNNAVRVNIPEWHLADRLRKSLEHAGVEVEEMAHYLEVHPNTVRNWLAGRTTPRASDVKLWAMRVGIPHEWIAHGVIPSGDEGLPRVDSNHQPAGWLTDSSTPPSTRELTELGSLRKRIRKGPLSQTAHQERTVG